MLRSSLLILASFIGIAVVLGGCASSSGQGAANSRYDFSSISQVAVVDVVGEVPSEAAKGQITSFFNQHLLEKGYNPIERLQIAQLLNEQDFEASGLTDERGAAQMGRLLNLDAVILVNVPRFDEKLTMSAKMLDVETGSVLWTASSSASTGSGMNTALGALGGAVAGSVVGGSASGGNTGVTVASGAAGAVGGGLAGELLTPEKEEQAQKMIAKLTDSLPSATGG